MKLAPALFLLLTALSLPARAALFDDDEARARIEQLRVQSNARLDKLEAASRSQLELANQLEALKAEMAKLRGQIEVLTYELETAQKRQKDFYIDLDSRLRKLETPVEPQPATPVIDPALGARDYEIALNFFKAGKYREALTAFQNFIKTYPSSGYQPSAHYWSGNAHYQLREYARAFEFYNKVYATWPNEQKAPDALLGIANCQQETGDGKGARKTLESIVAKYPDTSAAQIAQQRLKKK